MTNTGTCAQAQGHSTSWAAKNRKLQMTGVGCHFLLQGIFPIQGSNPGLPHCRQMLYRLSHQGSHNDHTGLAKYYEYNTEVGKGEINPSILAQKRFLKRITEWEKNKLQSITTRSILCLRYIYTYSAPITMKKKWQIFINPYLPQIIYKNILLMYYLSCDFKL